MIYKLSYSDLLFAIKLTENFFNLRIVKKIELLSISGNGYLANDDILNNNCFLYFKKGEDGAFKVIYHKYKRQLYVICYKYLQNACDAEDMVLHTFNELYQNRHKINDIKHLNNWLYITARNNSIELKKTKYQKKEIEYRQFHRYSDINIEYSEEVFTEIINQVYLEIDKLPKQQKEVFILRYVKNYTAQEVADKMQIEVNTVYAHSKMAMKNIKLKFLSTTKFST